MSGNHRHRPAPCVTPHRVAGPNNLQTARIEVRTTTALKRIMGRKTILKHTVTVDREDESGNGMLAAERRVGAGLAVSAHPTILPL